jgi:SAM-dependent methyltransferase
MTTVKMPSPTKHQILLDETDQPCEKSQHQFPDDFLKVEGIYLPARATDRSFDYSDGDAEENYMHQAIRSARDCSSASFELERSIKDWPSEYHFSRHRTNLLRPFPLHRYKRVLEIGAGCGAITRYLGETCGHVTALEGSRRRAAIIRDRCRDLENVACVSANLESVNFPAPFDLIIVIGVLEYAAKYFAHFADPYAGFLKLASRALSPDGLLILAIENQLGLKYFQGEAEDHTARPYEGIEGYYSGTSVRTFGKLRLLEYVGQAGLRASLFLPLPDYKLPRLIINAASANQGLRLSQWYDRQKMHVPFSDILVLPALEKNGLLADLANSFLVLAGKQESAIPASAWDAVYYSLNRKLCYQTETRLHDTQAGRVVSKKRLFPLSANGSKSLPIKQVVGTSPYAVGEKLSLAMLRALRRDGVEARNDFETLMSAWNSFLQNRVISTKTTGHDAALPSGCVDSIPFNLIITETGLREVDREWNLERDEVTIGWVLFRGLYWLLASYWPHIGSWRPVPGEWGPFIQQRFAELGYSLSRPELLDLATKESRFQEAILPGPGADKVAKPIIDNLGSKSFLRKGLSTAKRGWRSFRRLASAVRQEFGR